MSAFEDKISISGDPPYSKQDDQPSASDYKNQPKDGKTWMVLRAKHVSYDFRALNTIKENYLYQGGFKMNEPEIAKLFCPKMRNEEDDTIFKERVQSAAYIPTFSKLITGLISNLFSQDLAVMEAADHNDPTTEGEQFTDSLRDFYKEFCNNCDGAGTSLHNFMRHSTTKALIHSFNYFGVDYPKGEANNLLEQELKGLDRPRLYKIDSESVFDWKTNDTGDFEWIKLVDCHPFQPSPFDPPMQKYCVKTWFINEQGFAAYECYESNALPLGKEPKIKEVLKKVDEGVTSFKQIPIFCFQLDEGIAVGAKLAPMAAEHFNRITIENYSTNRACITVPVHYKGDMFPGGDVMPDPIMMNSSRGHNPRGKVSSKGIFELGSYTQDRFEIVEAEGKALGFIHKQNEDLDEKMHSVVHQMGQSLKQSRTQSGKSGLSKQEDRRATEMLLTAIADEVFNLVAKVFNVISDSRGEDIVWDVRGLSALATDDRAELTQEAATIANIAIPSETFRKEYHFRIASRLIEGTDQRTLQTIRREIEDGMESMALEPGQTIAGKNAKDQSLQNAKSQPTAPKQPQSDKSVEQPLGPAGQKLMDEGSHLQTGQYIDASTVFAQLAEDYKEADIQWVKHIPWLGPVEVPLSSIDFSNKDNWQASQDPESVDKFADKMANDQFNKPIILVNNPSNDNKYMIVDGHHRSLAALENGQPVTAYIGQVGSDAGPWQKLHDKQGGSKQMSIQKQVSKQVSKSEYAPKGKTI